MSSQAKNLYLWNANSIKGKFGEIIHVLLKNKIDIIAINETKINKNDEFLYYDDNFYCVFKSRNNYGGGVGFIINKKIDFILINDLDSFNVECLCIKITINEQEIYLINYYNSPTSSICIEMFEHIEKNFKNYIISGDLNSKNKSFGCKINNENGIKINNFLAEYNTILLNTSEPTFHRDYNEYNEILDLMFCSNSIYTAIENFKVCYDLNLYSDHYPIMINFKNNKNVSNDHLNEINSTLDFSRANWHNFKQILEAIDINNALLLEDPNKINEFIVNNIHDAINKAIPLKNPNKTLKIKLPKYLVKLIKHKRYLNKIKKNDQGKKSEFNTISRIIKDELDSIKNQNWKTFADKQKENPLICKQFWKRINNIKNQNTNLTNNYPKLVHNNVEYNNDFEKAYIYCTLLSEIFQNNKNENYDNNFKKQVDEEVFDFLQKNEEFNSIQDINLSNLDKIIKSLKPTLSSGEDKISNLMLKKLGPNFKKIINHLINISIKQGKIPDRWKIAVVKMIPKKNDALNNPNNYRPISLTNCLARVCERALLIKINEHLKRNKIIVKQQSGFRANRQTKDNIFHLCQKNLEAFNRKMKNCVIFFDITKAFDKIWHNGLLYKLINNKFEKHIIKWIAEFLNKRVFKVKVNSSFSNNCNIEVGVPQGSVLSPILFSIFINDIIFDKTQYKKTKTESTLFADDLATSCCSNNMNVINQTLELYLLKLENWLYKWRLTINPKKCQFILFSKGKHSNNLDLRLFNQSIPETDNIKFLGITFDRTMTFNTHIQDIKTKCYKRLNIIKILKHKSWRLKPDTLKNIYFSLIRSIIDYASTIFNIICESKKTELRSIQYHALKIAYNKQLKCSHKELLQIASVTTIDERCKELNENYFEKSFLYDNELTNETITNYLNIYPDSREPKFRTILCYYRNIIKHYFK